MIGGSASLWAMCTVRVVEGHTKRLDPNVFQIAPRTSSPEIVPTL
jgi:hypothetical protein